MAVQVGNRMRSNRPFPHPLPIGMFHLDDNPPPADPPPDDPPADPPADPPYNPPTKDELDRMLAAARKRERDKVADYEELKAKAAKLDEHEAASKSELEKERERATKAEEAATRAVETANRRLIEAAVLSEGARQNAVKPEHLHRLIDTESVTVGDDGQVTGVADAVKAFLKTNPEYVGSGRAGGSADQGARGKQAEGQLTRADLQGMSSEAIVKARREGRTAVLEGRTP